MEFEDTLVRSCIEACSLSAAFTVEVGAHTKAIHFDTGIVEDKHYHAECDVELLFVLLSTAS